MDQSGPIIGVDESGKGDFFGPLVIAGFCAPDSERSQLESLGVRDSKQIAEKKLLGIDEILRKRYPHELVVIGAERYNELYARIRNLNKLLAWGHARVIENLLLNHRATLAISDKFGDARFIEEALLEKGRGIEIQQIVRGESIVQVAAASIIARAEFVRQVRALSEEIDMPVPRGAGALVDAAARAIVDKYGPDILKRIAKTHFKNFSRVANPGFFR